MSGRTSSPTLVAIVFFLGILAAFPAPAQAANATFLGPIVPEECNCKNQTAQDGTKLTTAPDYGCVLQVVQNSINFAVSAGILLTVLYIAWAGFSFILNSTNPGKRTEARTRIWNGFIGLALILSSWLIIDFLMKTFYDEGSYGPWNAILADTGNHQCIQAKTPTPITTGVVGTTGSPSLVTSTLPGTSSNNSGVGACNASTVQAAAVAGGYSMTLQEAQTLSCVAGPESNCGSTNKNYNWNGVKDPSKPSTAYGAFQVTLSGNSACYNNTACQKAAGVSGSLDCSKGFSKGKPIQGSAIEAACERAAANLSCNAIAGACVLKKQGISAWTADSHATTQGSCSHT